MRGGGEIVGDNGGGRSEGAVSWRVCGGDGVTRVGERGGGRDA